MPHQPPLIPNLAFSLLSNPIDLSCADPLYFLECWHQPVKHQYPLVSMPVSAETLVCRWMHGSESFCVVPQQGSAFPLSWALRCAGGSQAPPVITVNYTVPVRGAGPSLSANHQQEDDDELTKDWCDAVVRCFQVYVLTLLLHTV